MGSLGISSGQIASAGGGGGGGGSAYLGVGVTEDFQRANENPVGAGSVGPAPILLAGTWQITSNQLVVNSVGEAQLWWYTDTLNYVLTTTVDVPSGDGGVLWNCGAAIGNLEYYLLEVSSTVHGGNYTVFYRANGSFVEYPGTGDTGVLAANNDVIKLTVRGPKTIININSVDRFTAYTTAVGLSPVVGFRSNSSAALKVRNFVVTPTL